MSNTIEVENAPAIPGLRFRQFAGERDYPELVQVAVESMEGDADFLNVDSMRSWDAATPWVDQTKDRFVVEVDGKMIGGGRVQAGRNVAGEWIYTPAFNLRPAWRGKGIGTAALGHMEKRLREIAANHPQDEPRYFQTWPVYQKHVATERLLRRHGYQGVRNSFDMVRPTMDDIPECPLPDGVEFRPVEESHLRAIWGANVEAFRDHWNYIARAESAFEAWAHAPFWKKELSAIAWDGDECVGTVLAQVSEEEIQKLGRRRIWTESIAVRRPWRKRGVARAMMAECLRLGRDAGYVEAALGVDAENLTGALRIYEAMGYRVTKQGTTFRKVMVE